MRTVHFVTKDGREREFTALSREERWYVQSKRYAPREPVQRVNHCNCGKRLCVCSDALPPGATCDDCAHARRCDVLIESRDRTHCDWTPSRFRAAVKQAG